MPYFAAARFVRKHGGVKGLIRLIEMLDENEPCENIASEFHMTKGNVTQLHHKLGKYRFVPCDDVLKLIEDKSEDKIHVSQQEIEYAKKLRGKVISLSDFRTKQKEGE